MKQYKKSRQICWDEKIHIKCTRSENENFNYFNSNFEADFLFNCAINFTFHCQFARCVRWGHENIKWAECGSYPTRYNTCYYYKTMAAQFTWWPPHYTTHLWMPHHSHIPPFFAPSSTALRSWQFFCFSWHLVMLVSHVFFLPRSSLYCV